MADQVTDTLLFLHNPALPVTAENKATLIAVASAIIETDLTPDNKTLVINALKNGAKTRDIYKAILIECMLLSITGNAVHSARIAKHLKTYKPKLAEANSSYLSLTWQRFRADDSTPPENLKHCSRAATRPLFLHILNLMDKIYQDVIAGQITPFIRSNRVVVVTRQMMMPPHAPSVRTLEFAQNLIETYGKEVMIVSSSEVSKAYSGAFVPPAYGKHDERFIGQAFISFEGHNIPFVMCGNGTFSEDSVRQGIRAIHEFSPEMILSIGSPNLLPELFHRRAFCFFYMSGRDLPQTRNQYFHTWEEPSETQRKQLRQEQLEDKHLFVSTPGYHVKKQTITLYKADYAIPEDAFVFAIIGMRLDTEITAAFCTMLQTIEKETDCYFIFAGDMTNFDTTFKAYPALQRKCRYLDMQPDIMAVYALANAYINPDRKGGGSSAAQALQAGLPVLTLPSGDVGFMAVNFPSLPDYAAMANVAIKLTHDPKTKADYKACTIKEAARVSVRDQYLDRIIGEFENFAARKELEQQA